MAPNVPAEIDVFTIPHLRMKELVNIYTQKVQCIDYRDCQQVCTLLNELKSILHEFKSHESIENMFIMDQLKNRLKQRHIYNSAVCDCHNDNRLTEIMKLVKRGKYFWKSSIGERINFGKELQSRFTDFVQQFLPHMEEEETIFQPLLVEHFEYDELCILKEVVLEQHELIRDPLYHEKAELDTPETDEAIKDFRDLDAESCFLGNLFFSDMGPNKCDAPCRDAELHDDCNLVSLGALQPCQSSPSTRYNVDLPGEILIMIFSHLQPPDRGRCAQVCSSWNQAVYSGPLWKELYPIQWTRGIWAWNNCHLSNQLEDEATLRIPQSPHASKYDEDADIDECEEDLDPISEEECILFTSLVEYVLPRVGIGVEKLFLDGGRGLSSRLLNEALALCPNITQISAAYTLFDYYTFKGLWKHNSLLKLKHLDLQGCEFMDDNALTALAECHMLKLEHASLQYCPQAQPYFCNISSPGCCRKGSRENFIHSKGPSIQDPHNNYGVTCPCPYDVRWMGNERFTEIEELYNRVYDCRCFRLQNFRFNSKGACVESFKSHELSESLEEPSLLSLNLSGCWRITDYGISSLIESGFLKNVHSLNVGGCFHISGSILNSLIEECRYLKPERLTYCNNIRDGPYASQANGCDTICHPIKVCCQSLVKN